MKSISTSIFLLIFSFLLSVPSYASIPTTGKGMWIWEVWTHGTLDSMISTLKKSGVTWVAVKLGDSNSLWDQSGQNLYEWSSQYGGFASVIDSFHTSGIKVYGWQYVYGTSKWSGGGTEAGVTNEILDIPGIDGFIIDAEVEFEASGMTAVAAQYLGAVRAAHPNSFVALTSFARVTGQPIPWTTFLSSCDANMPQAYWAARPTSPSQEFNAMRTDFESWEQTWINEGYISSIKPIVPIGEEYGGSDGYQQHYGDISQFCSLAQGAGYVGVSLWRYGVMDTMNWRDYANSWGNPTPTTPEVTSASLSTGDTLQVYDSVKVSFNIAMDAGSLDTAFTITPHVNGKLIMNPDFTNWTFAPDTLLAPSTNYTITFSTSAASLLGTPLNSPYSLSFSTGPIDTSAPTVIAASPENGGTSISKAYIEFILNEPVQLNNVSSFLSFVDSTGNKVPFAQDVFRVASNGLSLVAIRSLTGLIPGMRYTITLAPGVTSYFNIPTKEPYSTTFTVSTSQSSGGSVIEGFESSLGTWQQPSANPLTYGLDTTSSSFAIVYRPYDGYQSGALQYQFDSTKAVCAEENSQGFDISSSGSFGMWIFGDNSGNELDFIFGPTSEHVIPIDTINWYGWKYIGMWRANTDTTTSLFKGFAIKRLSNSLLESGTIYVDDIQVNGIVTGVGGNITGVPNSFMLFQNYPNPFNPTTVIKYQLKAAGNVTLKVYDVLGREVATLVNERQNEGSHVVTFNAARLPSGVYFYSLEAGTYTATKKMVLVK